MLTITIKDLRQATFALTIDAAETVATLKRRIEAERGATEFAASRQCLIYSGRILEDERQLREYELDEKKFVVLMVKKEAMVQRPRPREEEAELEERMPAAARSCESTSSVPEPNMLAVAHIVEMGYTRPEALQAMRLCRNNYEHAIEFLLTGELPEPDVQSQSSSTPAAPTSTFPSSNPLAFLRDLPDFRHMQQLVRTDPQSLHTIIQQLETTEPELFRAIVANVPAFVEILSEGMLDDVEFPFAEVASAGPDPSADSSSSTGEDGVISVPLTGPEREAVLRLMELGFEEVEAVQAYLAFEKNEQLAAEFLLEMHEMGGPD